MIRRASVPVRKKSLPEPKMSSGVKRKKSPLPSRRLGGDGTYISTSQGRLRPVNTAEGALSSSLDGHHSQDDLDPVESNSSGLNLTATNGGSTSDATADDYDLHDGSSGPVDPQRTKAAIDQLQQKILKTMESIKQEQNAKEENVNEYLRLSSSADKQQIQRIKTLFEKRNQKSTQSLAQLQRKLETYQKRLKDVETYGVSGHKQAREVLRDVGQGLKGLFARDQGNRGAGRDRSPARDVGTNIRSGLTGFSGGVVDNIRGAKETIVSKPKEFAHLIKNKFGSADNINAIKTLEESQASTDEGDKQSHPGSSTLPAGFKCYSDDDAASVGTSGSGPSGTQSSPRPQSQSNPALVGVPTYDFEPILKMLQENAEGQQTMQESFEALKVNFESNFAVFKQALEEERYRSERLEEQINDLTELHQHEVTNIKQELSSMEEKMEYQLEERTRDMQELLETCQTRITKMELQQQQQQLISMEGIENSNFRALITKLINVVLALLAVIFVFVSTIANLLGPFLTTRLRILSTICLVACIVAAWQNWSFVEDCGHRIAQQYRHILSVQ